MKSIPTHITYGATEDGRIIDLRKDKEIKPFVGQDGYKRVYLTNKDGTKAYSVSRLIAITFVPNPDNKPEIDHINRDRGDNRIENLRWANDYEQAINKGGKGGIVGKKCIHFETVGNHDCWTLQVRNNKLKIKKRFDARIYSLDDVVKERNTLFNTNGLPITD